MGLYVILLVLAIAATWLLRRRIRSGPGRQVTHQPPLTVVELAYLSGGRARMVEVAIASLLDRKVLRVDRSGRVQAVSGTRGPVETELEALVLKEIERYGRSVAKLRRAIIQSVVFTRVEGSLVERGLLSTRSYGAVAKAATPLLAVTALGIVRIVNGVSLDRPVGFLVALVVVAAILTGFAMVPQPVKPTSTAKRIVSSARRGGERSYGPELPMMAGAIGLVAIGGLAAYPDDVVVEALAKQSGSVSAGGGGCAGATASSGSSCGGGGGGGSCGGGGGGGGGGCGG